MYSALPCFSELIFVKIRHLGEDVHLPCACCTSAWRHTPVQLCAKPLVFFPTASTQHSELCQFCGPQEMSILYSIHIFDIWEGLTPIDATRRLFEASSAQAKKRYAWELKAVPPICSLYHHSYPMLPPL